MQRTIVNVAMMRIIDLTIGDVMNRDPAATTGWFTVQEIRRLPNGELNVTGAASKDSIMGADNDIVGVQVAKRVEQHAV